MKRVVTPFIFITGLIICITDVSAQLRLDAQIRPRLEYREGFQDALPINMNTDGDLWITQRTRLSFTYENSGLKIKLVPQDVRYWSEGQLTTNSGGTGKDVTINMYEAYAELQLNQLMQISLGRQELVYDNQSILSNSNWNQSGLTSDAMVIKLRNKSWKTHLGGIWNMFPERGSNVTYQEGKLKTMGFLWVNRIFKNGSNLSLTHLSTGSIKTDTSQTIYLRQTSGIYTDIKLRYFNAICNLYYQYGKNQNGYRVSAWLADADLSRRFGQLTPGIGISYFSGNSSAMQGSYTDKSFYTIFRSKHQYNGNMDLFTNMKKHTDFGGIIDPFIYLSFRFNQKMVLKNTLHYFSLANLNPYTQKSKPLGLENDLVFTWRFAEWGSLETGYLIFFPSDAYREHNKISHKKLSNFVNVMLSLTPNMFTH